MYIFSFLRCLQTLWADQLSRLPTVSELSSENHLLLPQLPVQHRHPCSDLPHWSGSRLLWRQRYCDYYRGEWGKLLQHQETECLHWCCVPTATGAEPTGFSDHSRDETLEAGEICHLPSQALRLHHTKFTLVLVVRPLWNTVNTVNYVLSNQYLTMSFSVVMTLNCLRKLLLEK